MKLRGEGWAAGTKLGATREIVALGAEISP